MNKYFWKKTAAGLMALLIVAGAAPVYSSTKTYEMTTLTAHAATNIEPTPKKYLVAEKNHFGAWMSQELINAGIYDEKPGYGYYYQLEILEIDDDTIPYDMKQDIIDENKIQYGFGEVFLQNIPIGSYPGKYRVTYGISNDQYDVKDTKSFDVIIAKEETEIELPEFLKPYANGGKVLEFGDDEICYYNTGKYEYFDVVYNGKCYASSYSVAVNSYGNLEINNAETIIEPPTEKGSWFAEFKKGKLYVSWLAAHSVTIADGIENGTITPDKETAKKGDKVNLTVTPAENCNVNIVSVNGTEINAVDGVYSFEMPDEDVTVSAEFNEARPSVTYIGEDGKEETITYYTVLTSNKTTLTSGTYVVIEDVNYTSQLMIKGNVKIILCDGKTLDVTTDEQFQSVLLNGTDGNGNKSSLTIYGQEKQSGKFNVINTKGRYAFTGYSPVTINGGDITFEAPDELYSTDYTAISLSSSLTINNGKVKAKSFNGISGDKDITINGGQVEISSLGGNAGCDNVVIGADKETDYIKFGEIKEHKYNKYNIAGYIKIADGQTLVDQNGKPYYGTIKLKDDDKSKGEMLAGKTFVRAYTITLPESTANGNIAVDKTYVPANAENKTVTLTLIPNEGYQVKSVKVNDTVITPVDGVYSFTMPAEDVIVTAEFEEEKTKYSFTLPEGLEYVSSVQPDENGNIEEGAEVKFAVDDDHYLDENSFVALDANGENKLTPDEDGVYSVTVTGDTAIYASLAEKYIKGACGKDFSKSYKNITYTYNKQTKVMTLSGTGKMKENTYLYFDNIGKDVKKVVIGEGITNIGESAFYEFENMEEIEIGKDVKSIDSYAFQSCKSLKKVVLPEELTTIGKMGFYRCSALEEIVIPKSCQDIGEAAFESCINLRSIKLPYGIAEIKSQTFKYCESLETIEIPESVGKIGVEAMYECKSLKSIDLPKKLTEIGAGAFAYNYALEEVKFSNLLKTIGDKAFFNCQKIKEVNFPNTLESIGKEAFYGNNSIQSVKIPANVTSIGESAFIYCENILSIEIAESEKDQTIGEKAFFYCKSATSVKIPSSVVSIGKDALFSIDNNAKIEYNGTMTQWKAIGGADATSKIIVPSSYAYTITTVKDTEHFDMIVRNFNTADSESQAKGGDAGDELKVDISNIKDGYYIKYVECSYDGGKTWTKLTNSYFKLSEGNLIVRAVAEEIPSINYVTENNGESGDVKALPLNQYTSPFINDNYSVYYIDGDYKSIDYSSVRLYNNDGVTLVLADDVTFETSAIMNSEFDYPHGIAYFSDITITKPVGAKGTGTISAYYIYASNIALRAGIIETQNVSAYGVNELSSSEKNVASGVLTLDFSDENSSFCGSVCDRGEFTVGSVVIPDGKTMLDGTNSYEGTLSEEEMICMSDNKILSLVKPTSYMKFIDINGIEQNVPMYSTNISAGEFEVASSVYLDGYDFKGWEVNGKACDNIADVVKAAKELKQNKPSEQVVLKPIYERVQSKNKVKLANGTFEDGTFEKEFNSSELVTVKAATIQGMNFSHWTRTVNGEEVIVSYNEEYTFYMTSEDVTLTSCYVDIGTQVEKKGTAFIEKVTELNGSDLAFTAILNVPDNCTMIEGGLVAVATYSNDIGQNVTMENAVYKKLSKKVTSATKNLKYTWTKTYVHDPYYVRPYLLYADENGVEHTVYGDVVVGSLSNYIAN